jgi:hypothetical protein
MSENMTVKDLIEELQCYDQNKPIVMRRGIGWTGMTNEVPYIGEETINADFSDDYSQCREDPDRETIEVVTLCNY